MSNGTGDLTDKQVILQMIKGDKTLGFRLANPHYQNELVLRFIAFHNPGFRELVYDGKLATALVDECHPVEGIVRTASEIAYAMTNGRYRDEYAKGILMRRGDIFHPDELNAYETLIMQVLLDMLAKGFGTNVYNQSSWLCFSVWMQESPSIRKFMEEQPTRIYQVRAFKAISVSRLRRFLVEEGYGNKPSVPLVQ